MTAKILIVDDNALNLELASQLLEDDYIIATATNGKEAMREVALFQPDLVLMDLSMPIMDGWEATRRLRQDPANAGLKIVALSAHAIPAEIERALGCGCDGFVTKPIDDDLLMHTVREMLGE
jgi:two-component system cell cycle response regulator DivK